MGVHLKVSLLFCTLLIRCTPKVYKRTKQTLAKVAINYYRFRSNVQSSRLNWSSLITDKRCQASCNKKLAPRISQQINKQANEAISNAIAKQRAAQRAVPFRSAASVQREAHGSMICIFRRTSLQLVVRLRRRLHYKSNLFMRTHCVKSWMREIRTI